MNKRFLILIPLFMLLVFLFSIRPAKAAPSNNPIFATLDEVQQMINTALSPFQSSIQGLSNRVSNLEATVTTSGKLILDLQQVRGSFWQESDPVNNVATPDHVTVNCSKACNLWVNYDVDTRNTSTPFQHLYLIYVDGVDQAVFNQATMTTPNAAVPLAVNGVFPKLAGTHTVSIYARTYGGTLQSYESHLQVMAVEQ